MNMKQDVVMALKSTGVPVFFFNVPAEANDLPCLTYYELDNSPHEFADNMETMSKITIVVDVYSSGSTSELAHKVNCVLFELGFIREMAQDIPEPTPDVFHKTMRFSSHQYNY